MASIGAERSLADVLFDWEERQFGRMSRSQANAILDKALNDLSVQSAREFPIARQISILNRLLFRGMQLKYGARILNDGFSLTSTLLRGVGNCLGLTSVCLAVAEPLGIPMRALLFEGHIAVCHAQGDRLCAAVELSRGGVVLSERLASRMYSAVGHARVLSGDEFLAVHLSNRAAFVLAARGENEEAHAMVCAANSIFPDYAAAWVNRAALSLKLGRSDEASDALERCLELNPGPICRRAACKLLERAMYGRLRRGCCVG